MSTTIGYAILADLGNLKVFSIQQTDQKTNSLQAYESVDNIEGHAKLSEIYSDKAGDYSNAVSDSHSTFETKSGMEREARLIESLAEFINHFAKQHPGKLYISISKPIHAQIKDNLNDSTLNKIKVFLGKDLNRQNVGSIMGAFEL